MISVTDLRAGITYEEDGNLLQVLSYTHIKMGRGSANIKVKVKNLKNGAILEKSYVNGARIKDVQLQKRDLQFLYKDDESANFMDPVSYEQITILLSLIPDHQYLKEGESASVSFLNNDALSVSFPAKLVFEVIETGPSFKGNSATNVFKDALLENNIKTKVPMFINTGEKIKIDTRTRSYSEKVQ